MPANLTKGRVLFKLRDAFGDILSDQVDLEFRNMRLSSLNFRETVQFQGEHLTLKGVPAFPQGNWQVTIIPKKYRFKSVFASVPSSGSAVIDETFFVDPGKVTPIFPTDEEFQTLPQWQPLISRIKPGLFKSLANEQKAGLLNIYAKMGHTSANSLFDDVIDIFEVRPARIFTQVKTTLLEDVRGLPGKFHEALGLLHNFPSGWDRFKERGSYKTPDPTGNLQLTFATNAQEGLAVDADLDDNQGIKHAFDVIRHTLTGSDSHPYDIHQILVKFQNIDPGYRF
jgi:hypothetical protein